MYESAKSAQGHEWVKKRSNILYYKNVIVSLFYDYKDYLEINLNTVVDERNLSSQLFWMLQQFIGTEIPQIQLWQISIRWALTSQYPSTGAIPSRTRCFRTTRIHQQSPFWR